MRVRKNCRLPVLASVTVALGSLRCESYLSGKIWNTPNPTTQLLSSARYYWSNLYNDYRYVQPSLLIKAPCGAWGIPLHTVMGFGYPGSVALLSSLYLQYLSPLKKYVLPTGSQRKAVSMPSRGRQLPSSTKLCGYPGSAVTSLKTQYLSPGDEQGYKQHMSMPN